MQYATDRKERQTRNYAFALALVFHLGLIGLMCMSVSSDDDRIPPAKTLEKTTQPSKQVAKA